MKYIIEGICGACAIGLILLAIATYPLHLLTGPDSVQGFTVCVFGASIFSVLGFWASKIK